MTYTEMAGLARIRHRPSARRNYEHESPKEHNSTAMTEKARIHSTDVSDDGELITDPARIVPLLELLARQNTPLTVRIPGDRELYTSCTVGVEKPHVLLDEFMPSSGHALLLNERTVRVTCKLDGIDVRFSLSLERVDEQKNLLTYYMGLPKQIEYRQRRMDYRVNIPISNRLRVIIDNEDNSISEVDLHDLSQGGVGLITPASAGHLSTGRQFECAIELPGAVWLYCTLEMRYSKQVSARNRQHTGARFSGLNPAQKRMIGRCISELEREFIRKRAAYE